MGTTVTNFGEILKKERHLVRIHNLTCAALLWLLSYSFPASAQCTSGILPLSHYDGTIGQHRIRMTLELGPSTTAGLYFYASQLKDISVKGKIIDGRRLVLEESNSAGVAVAQFDGTFQTTDPGGHFGPHSGLTCEVIRGTWRKLNSEEELPFYLALADAVGGNLNHQYASAGADDDDLINSRAKKFWIAVKSGDAPKAASLIAYPITVCKKKIRGPAEFIRNYASIFPPAFQDAIMQALPRAMFARDQGVMLGNGEVWFNAEGEVIALNGPCKEGQRR